MSYLSLSQVPFCSIQFYRLVWTILFLKYWQGHSELFFWKPSIYVASVDLILLTSGLIPGMSGRCYFLNNWKDKLMLLNIIVPFYNQFFFARMVIIVLSIKMPPEIIVLSHRVALYFKIEMASQFWNTSDFPERANLRLWSRLNPFNTFPLYDQCMKTFISLLFF